MSWLPLFRTLPNTIFGPATTAARFSVALFMGWRFCPTHDATKLDFDIVRMPVNISIRTTTDRTQYLRLEAERGMERSLSDKSGRLIESARDVLEECQVSVLSLIHISEPTRLLSIS